MESLLSPRNCVYGVSVSHFVTSRVKYSIVQNPTMVVARRIHEIAFRDSSRRSVREQNVEPFIVRLESESMLNRKRASLSCLSLFISVVSGGLITPVLSSGPGVTGSAVARLPVVSIGRLFASILLFKGLRFYTTL